MPRVVHFEIHVDNPDRAMRFYEAALGWSFSKWDGPHEYWLITTGPKDQPGIDGGLLRRMGPNTGTSITAYICTVDVPSVDDYARRATDVGGEIVKPKMPIPGVGWLLFCKDTEGNIFGMMQADASAK